MKGILNLYKPKGMSSAAAVGKARRILGVKTAGHFGTLDPAGEGVLLIGVGRAARLFDFFLKGEKRYEAVFTFGYQTDTLDGEGAVVKVSEIIPTAVDIGDALRSFVGNNMQLPPAYSAKSLNGVRAYTLARRGEEIELKPAAVQIFDAQLLGYNSPAARVLIRCSSGTYIRSICRDVAEKLNSAATMTAIKRVASGAFKVENSISFKELEAKKGVMLIPLEYVLKDLPQVCLDGSFKKRLDNGVRISVLDTEMTLPKSDFTLYADGELYGIAHIIDGKIAIKTLLKD
ncbi:MAG: tRNA pseudouridine(55) synthase TruB [Firmicutes bacterium]|nr:tRNA pseudouridine(55) synthase TruB [Bacillota bacterium]